MITSVTTSTDTIAICNNDPPGQLASSYVFEAEELTRIILEETPEAVDAFETREEMVKYIQEAMSCAFGCHTKLVPNENKELQASGNRMREFL